MTKQLRTPELLVVLLVCCAWVAIGSVLAYASVLIEARSSFLAFVPAIAVCCRLYDLVGGVISSGLSTLALWDWFVPPEGFALPTPEDARHLLAFLVVSIFVCWIIHRERRSNDELAQENFELGYKLFLMRALRGRTTP